MAKPARHILVCTNARPPGHPRGSCGDAGVEAVYQQLNQEFEEKQLYDKAMITTTGCIGPCAHGPIVVVYPDDVWYSKVDPASITKIVDSHIIGGKPVEELMMPDEVWG